MIPAWLLLLAVAVGAVAGWYARGRVGPAKETSPSAQTVPVAAEQVRETAAAMPAVEAEPVQAAERKPSEEVQRLDRVLSELERRYESRRTAEGAEEAARPPRPRRRRAS